MLRRLIEAVKWLAYLVFWVGLGVGVYVRWKNVPEPGWIVAVAAFSSTSIVFCLLLLLKESSVHLPRLSKLLISANPSFLLGVLCFSRTQLVKDDYYEMVMNLILFASLVIYVIGIITLRSMTSLGNPVFFESYEIFALTGISLAAIVTGNLNTIGILCSIAFIGLLIFSFHRRNVFIIVVIPLYVLLNMWVILDGEYLINQESLAVFALILIAEPLINIYASAATSLDSWAPVLQTPLCILKLTSLLFVGLEAILLFLVGMSLRHHKEWWVVVPLFIICSALLWLPSHIIYLVANWKLWGRVRKAVEILNTDSSRSLSHILSSRGLRHFALITYPLVWGKVVITVVQFVWGWTTLTDVTSGLFLICLPIQIIIIGFLRDLSKNLGGTCCGHALVTPSVLRSEDGENFRAVETSSSYATRTIGLIQEFFNHHLIADGGCEYLSDRMTEGALKSKLEDFFRMKTKQGLNYDSYLLYYSGPVNQAGDWILKGGILSYAQLITLWMDHGVSETSRLILVLDTAKSNYWVPHVRRTTTAYVGIQTIYVSREAENQQQFSVGDFTKDWVEFNCNKDTEVYSDSFRSPIIVTYGISTFWSHFRFHEPSVDEMDKHWQENFSVHMLRPVIQLCSLFGRNRLCCLCGGVGKWYTLIRLWIWAPNQLDIGHGFKLLRFFKVPGSVTIV